MAIFNSKLLVYQRVTKIQDYFELVSFRSLTTEVTPTPRKLPATSVVIDPFLSGATCCLEVQDPVKWSTTRQQLGLIPLTSELYVIHTSFV